MLAVDEAAVFEVRQVFDLPVLKMQVAQHQAVQVRCRAASCIVEGFPPT